MKKVILLLLTIIFSSSCSSSKITSSQWLSDDFKNQQINKMLVFANTEDKDLQKEFETKTAVALQKEGIVTLKMHKVFPNIEYKEIRTQDEIASFVEDCKEKNISKILFASRKSIIVDTVIKKSLHSYMNTLQPLKLGGVDESELEYETKEITTYIVEAAVYDINKPTKDEPIATTTLEATNPKTLDIVKDKFLKAIIKLFESK